jgi:fido (protein-threonine AMPylation protein)
LTDRAIDPPYRGIDWDDALERTAPARRALGRGQLRVERWIAERSHFEPLTVDRVVAMHRTMFEDVWPEFAGRPRGTDPGQIAMNVSFGNYRGVRFEDVPALCDELSANLIRFALQLDSHRRSESRAHFAYEVVRVAAYTHCELVRIHPFVNGNGRTARACINYFAGRYGLLPISSNRPNSEYLDANKTYLQYRIIDHFVDYLRLIMLEPSQR